MKLKVGDDVFDVDVLEQGTETGIDITMTVTVNGEEYCHSGSVGNDVLERLGHLHGLGIETCVETMVNELRTQIIPELLQK